MSLVMISRGSFSQGEEVAERVAAELGYSCISRELLLETSEEFNIPEIKLIRAFEDVPSILGRLSQGRKRYLAYIKRALFRHLKTDNVVYHGFAGHLLVRDIPHVLKVRIIAELEDRAKIVMDRDKVSEDTAIRFLHRIDQQRRRWSRKLYGMDPWDPALYDLVIKIQKITMKDAADAICRAVSMDQFQSTPHARAAMEDLALGAEVEAGLVHVKARIGVWAEGGSVYVRTAPSSMKNATLIRRLEAVRGAIPGIKDINLVAGRSRRGEYAPHPPDLRSKSTQDVSPTFFSEL
jgi:cytidylate kinase